MPKRPFDTIVDENGNLLSDIALDDLLEVVYGNSDTTKNENLEGDIIMLENNQYVVNPEGSEASVVNNEPVVIEKDTADQTKKLDEMLKKQKAKNAKANVKVEPEPIPVVEPIVEAVAEPVADTVEKISILAAIDEFNDLIKLEIVTDEQVARSEVLFDLINNCESNGMLDEVSNFERETALRYISEILNISEEDETPQDNRVNFSQYIKDLLRFGSMCSDDGGIDENAARKYVDSALTIFAKDLSEMFTNLPNEVTIAKYKDSLFANMVAQFPPLGEDNVSKLRKKIFAGEMDYDRLVKFVQDALLGNDTDDDDTDSEDVDNYVDNYADMSDEDIVDLLINKSKEEDVETKAQTRRRKAKEYVKKSIKKEKNESVRNILGFQYMLMQLADFK